MLKPSSSSTPQFKPGERVEISQEDPGFRGSWYAGTVLSRRKSNPNQYVVQYNKLFEDESERDLLQETLDWRLIRPAPPVQKNKIVFKLEDQVDAYHNDGWWEGTITEKTADGTFAVFFKFTGETIVFGERDLRLHMEWECGKWRRPYEQLQREKDRSSEETESRPIKARRYHCSEPTDDMRSSEETETRPIKVRRCDGSERVKVNNASRGKFTKVSKEKKLSSASVEHYENAKVPSEKTPKVVEETEFIQGMVVEVTSDEVGLKGAWYAATIIEASGEDTYLVQYKTLTNEDDTEFLREDVHTWHIRPCPPQVVLVDSFKLMEEVEAYYNDGWWVGVIAKVYANYKYLVHFKETEEKMVFKEDLLRPHRDWLNGKWIAPSKAKKL